ncbi:MAG TPA: HAD-IA family hydrolase [Candidatus Limnocylindria bacterium]|nr:HAD-IA family hydrolase [Candidatus Limnocylindria bacterium]
MPRYDAVGFDLLTALLHTWTLWKAVAGDDTLGERWHAASQRLLRGRDYYPFEENLRQAAEEAGVAPRKVDELVARWGEFDPWPDTPGALAALPRVPRFVVTNCSVRLGRIAAARAGAFDLVITAEEAGAYKPDPRAYRAALDALGLDPGRVLFVAGSAHDVGGAARLGMDVYWANRGGVPAPPDGRALREERDLRGLAEVVS